MSSITALGLVLMLLMIAVGAGKAGPPFYRCS